MAANQKLLQHPSLNPALELQAASNATTDLACIHGRVGGEAGARAAALQPAHRRAHRGGLHPLPRAARRRRAGGAGDHVAEGARHDVPQGRVGGGRVHGRGRPARGPGGGRRPRRHRADARLLALPEPPLRRPDLRGLHVPAPRRRRAPPVARDGLPQAHLGDGEPGDGRVPALVDAGGAREARRPARQAAVRSLIGYLTNRRRGTSRPAATPARKDRQHERTDASVRARSHHSSLGAAAGRPARIWSPSPEKRETTGRTARMDAGDAFLTPETRSRR